MGATSKELIQAMHRSALYTMVSYTVLRKLVNGNFFAIKIP